MTFLTPYTTFDYSSFPEAEWDSYTGYNEAEQIVTYYFLNISSLASTLISIFEESLRRMIPNPDNNIMINRQFIQVLQPLDLTDEHLAQQIKALQQAKIAFQEEWRATRWQAPASASTEIISADDITATEAPTSAASIQAGPAKAVSTPPTETKAPPKAAAIPVPIGAVRTIFFNGKRYRIADQSLDSDAVPPEDTVFPLHAPWLPEGKAYATVAPGVYAAVSTYLSPREVTARLKVGIVHGARAASKTKIGAVGIQVTDEPYQDINGSNHPRARFKLKFPDGTRIFGDLAAKASANNEDCVLYRFDGPAYGH